MELYALNQDELMSYTTEDNWLRRNRIGTIVDAYMLQIRESEENVRFYLAFCTKKGDILFGYGEDEGVLSLLVRLESSFRGQATTSFLERSLTETVGGDVDSFHEWSNANIPGYVIIGFASDNEEYVDGTQIPAPEKKNMGFAVFYHNQDRSGYRLFAVLYL